MGLYERLRADLTGAMKKGDAFATGLLRMLIAAVNNREIEKNRKASGGPLTDDEVAQVLAGEAKKRKESIEAFTRGGRDDLARTERREAEYIQAYLPSQMSREEVSAAVTQIVKRSAAKDFGAVMKEVMAQLKGKADAKLISELVKKALG